MFEIGLQAKDKGKSPSKKSTTPRSGKRKRRAISPIAVDQASLAPKTNKAKRSLYFSEKAEDISAPSKNILNLPYSDSEDEDEKGTNLAD